MNLAGYLLLFIAVGAGFVLVNLLAGKIIRPSHPGAEKGTIYECGEPTIGSAWVQFDLRFYVVALLFVIFDVEVAFFFPWAEVFGRANAVAAVGNDLPSDSQLADYGANVVALIPPTPSNQEIIQVYSDPVKLKDHLVANPSEIGNNTSTARGLALLALSEIVVFFGVLLVGFAYLWRRGDLEWVRSLSDRTSRPSGPLSTAPLPPVEPQRPAAPALSHGH